MNNQGKYKNKIFYFNTKKISSLDNSVNNINSNHRQGE